MPPRGFLVSLAAGWMGVWSRGHFRGSGPHYVFVTFSMLLLPAQSGRRIAYAVRVRASSYGPGSRVTRSDRKRGRTELTQLVRTLQWGTMMKEVSDGGGQGSGLANCRRAVGVKESGWGQAYTL